MNFTASHHQKSPLLLCNVWDVTSAQAAEQLNFQAIGTSSGAIASMLGYRDGEEMSFQELKYIVERITKSVDVPLTVDLEAGYSRSPTKIVEHIQQLADLGVVGINLEDSLVENGERKLLDAITFSKTLEKVCSIFTQRNSKMFINLRTDTFLLGVSEPVQETIVRAKKYHAAGAHGLFVPCIERQEDIESVINQIDLPLNVMCMPKLPNFAILKELGVQRISMGNFVFNKMRATLEKELKNILQDNSFKILFE